MPPFPRLGRHSNRSQQALVDLPAAPAAAVVAAGGGTGEATSSNQAQPQSSSLNPSPHLPPGQSQSQSNHHFHRPNQHIHTHNHAEAQGATDPSPSNTTAPPSVISTNTTNTTATNTESSPVADPRAAHQPPASQLPPSQQLAPAQPLPTDIGIAISGVPLPPPYKQQPQPYTASPIVGLGESPVLEGGRNPGFTPSPIHRSQTQRFSSYASIPPQPLEHQSHQHLRNQLAHGIGSASVDDLPGTRHHPNPSPQLNSSPAPEKRSKRNFIKGIFSSNSRSHNDQHQSSSHGFTLGHHRGQSSLSYENGVGLTRRQSRRASNLLDSQTQSPNTSPNPSDRDWHGSGPTVGPGQVYQKGAEPAPLAGIGESAQNHYIGPEPVQSTQSPSAQHLVESPTIRQVNTESDSSPTYDQVGYHQGQPNQQGQKEVAPPPHPPPHQHQQQQHSQAQSQTPPSQQPHAQALPQAQEQAHGYNNTGFDQQQQQQYHLANTSPTQPQHGEEPRIFPDTHSAAASVQYPNSETLSQVSHESPIATEQDLRANNQQPAQILPNVEHPARTQEPVSTPNLAPAQLASSSVQQSSMAPPPGAPPSNQRPAGGDREPRPVALRSQAEVPPGVPPGPPPGYRQNNSSAGQLTPLQPGAPQQGQPGPPPTPYTSGDHGRHSPAPPDHGESEKAFKDLLTKYKNVKRLYFDGKSQIENFGRQIEQLQNAVANQRMSQSRTALDDSEYSNRFNRLNGAINNLAFNIRKDWRAAPPWLAAYVSSDALKTGKQEMTAVGRAVISRWLMDQIFDRVFHPGLDPVLSSHLKGIELNIRGSAYTLNSQEEFDALTTKIVNWRMATLDGLNSVLNSPATTEHRQNLTSMSTSNLTAELYQYLNEPPPPGVEGSASMIVELAIGITANLPLESRDVAIVYPLPGELVQPGIMEIEKAPLPPLDDTDSGDDKEEKGKSQTEQYPSQTRNSLGDISPSSWTDGAASTFEPTSADKGLNPDEPRVRFAGFPALEVRGRQVLMKAPVWTL
ncbi:unnamed protein product [Clonostachys chloroleuca]|uniref:S-adenosylmethionine-dependent methyltransferase-like protein n=1 Tax=Clonostachys chloroleuca TaxID=1926264 RepID=A0AA35LVX8_9HYPO|nr:unnamed protein product [Clonostachys chloroleuca]